jgi:Ni,Fe-hydrogenase I large subunit
LKADGFFDDSLILKDNNDSQTHRLTNNFRPAFSQSHGGNFTSSGRRATPLKSLNLNITRTKQYNLSVSPISKKKIFEDQQEENIMRLSQTRSNITKAFESIKSRENMDNSNINAFYGENSRSEYISSLSSSALRRKSKIFEQPPKSPVFKEKILMDKNEFIFNAPTTPRGSASLKTGTNDRWYQDPSVKLGSSRMDNSYLNRSNHSIRTGCGSHRVDITKDYGVIRGLKKFIRPVDVGRDDKENEKEE